MDWERLETDWASYQPQAKATWSKLDDAELEATHGQRERLIDKVRGKYSYSQEEAEQEVDAWAKGL